MHWDGSRWLRWDGTQWVPAEPSEPSAVGVPGKQSSDPSRALWPFIIIGLLVLALVGAIATAAFFALSRDNSGAISAPTQENTVPALPTTPTPTLPPPVPQTYTLYFVNPGYVGGPFGAGVKVRDNQASGFAGIMQTGNLACFNGTYSGGYLTGTVVVPPDGEGGAITESFSWPVTGSGESFRLVSIGEVRSLREVPLVTMNDYADQAASESWEPLFENCASLAGGIG